MIYRVTLHTEAHRCSRIFNKTALHLCSTHNLHIPSVAFNSGVQHFWQQESGFVEDSFSMDQVHCIYYALYF